MAAAPGQGTTARIRSVDGIDRKSRSAESAVTGYLDSGASIHRTTTRTDISWQRGRPYTLEVVEKVVTLHVSRTFDRRAWCCTNTTPTVEHENTDRPKETTMSVTEIAGGTDHALLAGHPGCGDSQGTRRNPR